MLANFGIFLFSFHKDFGQDFQQYVQMLDQIFTMTNFTQLVIITNCDLGLFTVKP